MRHARIAQTSALLRELTHFQSMLDEKTEARHVVPPRPILQQLAYDLRSAVEMSELWEWSAIAASATDLAFRASLLRDVRADVGASAVLIAVFATELPIKNLADGLKLPAEDPWFRLHERVTKRDVDFHASRKVPEVIGNPDEVTLDDLGPNEQTFVTTVQRAFRELTTREWGLQVLLGFVCQRVADSLEREPDGTERAEVAGPELIAHYRDSLIRPIQNVANSSLDFRAVEDFAPHIVNPDPNRVGPFLALAGEVGIHRVTSR